MNRKYLFTLASTLLLALASCGGGGSSSQSSSSASSESSSQSQSSSTGSISVVSNYQPGDGQAHASKPAADVAKIRLHYHRFDDNGSYSAYTKWSLWLWDKTNGGAGAKVDFTHYDDFGVYVDVAKEDYAASIKELGYIVAVDPGGSWSGKDPDGDRSADFTGTAPGGVRDLYLVSGTAKVFDDPSNALKNSLDYARLSASSGKVITVGFSISAGDDGFIFDDSRISVYVDDKKVTNFTVGEWSNKDSSIDLTFTEDLKLTSAIRVEYVFDETWTDKTMMVITDYFSSEEFVKAYYYDGDDLGATFDDEDNPTKTTFKVWAPTSSKVVLNLFEQSDYRLEDEPTKIEMTLGEKGVYSTTVNENLDGRYYTYTVTNSSGTNEVTDPYAKSAGLNGKRGMVVNFKKLNEELMSWNADERPAIASASDASIYEIHVRDMTINPNSGVSENNRGRFLGLTETGKTYTSNDGVTVSTGLDHLAEVGATHVQIQPFYDYNSVEESTSGTSMSETNYNWGYDPQNYNVLEGSYSSDPLDGYARIKEAKQMIMALHGKGLNINMDVVYNHTGSTEGSNFQMLVPYYYYRTTSSGAFLNGSGCGNEVASNRDMVRKYIVDSTKFWTEEYHLSGFRFDLMGLEDNQTMIDVYNAVTDIYDKALVYGEPWDMGNLETGYKADNLSNQKTLQGSLCKDYFYGAGVYVGAFSDKMRDYIRGSNGPSSGYVQGTASKASALKATIQGYFSAANNHKTCAPQQVLNYASCHDNYTLYDQLIQTYYNKDRDFAREFDEAQALAILSVGIPFIQEGDDFMRTKAYEKDGKVLYCGNSYNVGDYINNMDYALKADNVDVFERTKAMFAIRNENAAFTPNDREAAVDGISDMLTDSEGNISYKISDGTNSFLVAYTLDGRDLVLDNGTLLFTNVKDATLNGTHSSYKMASNEVAVFKL